MKRTQRNWWDGRAQAKQELLRRQLDVTNKITGMLGLFGFAAEQQRLRAETQRKLHTPSFRSAAHGGGIRKAQCWTPQVKWQPKTKPAIAVAA